MKCTVIGAGKSGIAAALLAKRKGYEVFLTEVKSKDFYLKEIAELEQVGIEYEFGSNSEFALLNSELVITSPGVPPNSILIKLAELQKIPIISELEFAYQFIKNPIIAITGTNGKTTTTTLIDFILNNSGKKAVTAGNIGLPLSELVDKIDDETIIVCEVSSFQLDRIQNFRPNVAILLNITPDHLYYHKTMENYIGAKFKVFANQKENDLLIINSDDSETKKAENLTNGDVAFISIKNEVRGSFAKGNNLVINYPNQHKEENIMLLEEISIPGLHNQYNSMAAALAARYFEVSNENIRDSLMAFKGVEHRLEKVRVLDGVEYINDSKATNVNATWFALSSYNCPIIWLAGGRGDSNDYSELDELVNKNVKVIVAIGEEADAIFEHFCTKIKVIKEDSLFDAVNTAKKESEPGDVVLFTPACKSFDMFLNYEHRGDVYKDVVNSL
jgi:UDP-N-acetylmuramoylalanine--D-glutamate ligase